MQDPPIFFDPQFVQSVMVGWVLTVLGALLLLAAAVWWARAGEWLGAASRPPAWRALSAVGVLLFLLGWLWQIVGYVRVGAVTW